MRSRLPVSPGVIQTVLLALGLLIIVLVWTHYRMLDQRAREQSLDWKAAEHLNLAVIIAENLKQITDRARALGSEAARSGVIDAGRARPLAVLLASDPVFNRLVAFNSEGELLFASHDQGPEVLVSDWREQLQAHRSEFGLAPFLLAAEPDAALRPSWRLPILLPVADTSSQRLEMLLLIELDIGYLASLYQHLDLGRTGFIRLLDGAGNERMRADSSGVQFAVSRLQPALPARGSLQGQFSTILGGLGYQSMYRRMPQHGFTVMVSQSQAEILAPVEAAVARQRWLSLLISLVIVGSLLWLLRMLRTQQIAYQALQASAAENRRLIERLEKEHDRSSRAASTDHLSGLFNRRQFIQVAAEILAQQRSRRRLLAVLFIDLDRFKSINDTLGHRIGDLLLQAVAGRIQRLLEPGDQAARFGGDEFVVLLAGGRTELQIDQWVATLTERLSSTYQLDDIELNTSPSIGIAICPRDAQDVDGLIRNADAAMYSAKRAGRGRYRFYDASLNTGNVEAFHLEQGFAEALRSHQFVLQFQPLVHLDSGRIDGYEALVRWRHPHYGLLYPDRFIAVAERSGFIVSLGQEVLRLACEQLAQWHEAGLETSVAVNVSALQLAQPEFADTVLELLAGLSLPAQRLELEITETAILQRESPALDNLHRLRAAGIGVSLDDFGQGYAGFAHLQALPLTRLKIDRSLIAQLSNSHDDSLIVSTTIILAKRLKLQVVAEGVETREQRVHLRLAGCDLAQGYHFSRPMDAEAVPAFEEDFNAEKVKVPS